MRGVNFTEYQKRSALKMWLVDKIPVQKVCSKCHCTERSLWRWKAIFDGTLESLKPHTSRKGMPHPNSHTKEEAAKITKIFEEHPNIAYNEAYGILRTEMAYSRSFGGFYNFVKRHNIRPFQLTRPVWDVTDKKTCFCFSNHHFNSHVPCGT